MYDFFPLYLENIKVKSCIRFQISYFRKSQLKILRLYNFFTDIKRKYKEKKEKKNTKIPFPHEFGLFNMYYEFFDAKENFFIYLCLLGHKFEKKKKKKKKKKNSSKKNFLRFLK